MYAKEGFIIVSLGWIVISLVGALPFFLSGAIPNYIDALFETVSGFSTTGASILSGEQIDGMAKSLLLWRSFTHWVGGMGVLVLIMAFLPLSGARNMHMLSAESTGANVSKLLPKMRQTAIVLYALYFALTLLEFILLLSGGMGVFEALNTAFATAGTGGFTVTSSGMAAYNNRPFIQIVVTAFMLLFSINFTSYYLLLRGKVKDAFNAEVRAFLIIVVAAITLITVNLCLVEQFSSFGATLQQVAFNVASIVSTTGFGSVDFNTWPIFSKVVLVVLMFIGACAGSTGGGMKVSRWLVLGKGASHEVRRMLHPKQVKKISMDGKLVSHEVVRSINAYLVAYICVFVVSFLLICLDGAALTATLSSGGTANAFETAFTSVASALNNIGPGLGGVGPMENFSNFSVFSKIVFMFDMLAGRLEIFPMLILFAPTTWRK
jgi:trk system potassium uptake protein TrkH